MALGKSSRILGCLAIVGTFLLAFLFLGDLSRKTPQAKPGDPENSSAITATYAGTRLKQIDRTHATLSFAYDLANNTATDYQLADSPEILVMARLKADGALSQTEALNLSYSVIVPANQTVRVEVQEQYTFAWPPASDPGLDDKLKNFVRERLQNIAGLVLFDEMDHWQVELPSGWAAIAKN
jgi:hypothetical protein